MYTSSLSKETNTKLSKKYTPIQTNFRKQDENFNMSTFLSAFLLLQAGD